MRFRIGYLRPGLIAPGLVLLTLAGCSTPGTPPSGNVRIVGDARGGRVDGGVREGETQAAMSAVTAHCTQHTKKAFITQMEAPAQGGLLVFVCLDR